MHSRGSWHGRRRPSRHCAQIYPLLKTLSQRARRDAMVTISELELQAGIGSSAAARTEFWRRFHGLEGQARLDAGAAELRRSNILATPSIAGRPKRRCQPSTERPCGGVQPPPLPKSPGSIRWVGPFFLRLLRHEGGEWKIWKRPIAARLGRWSCRSRHRHARASPSSTLFRPSRCMPTAHGLLPVDRRDGPRWPRSERMERKNEQED